MTGFDEKVLHLWHEAEAPVTFTIEVDPLGSGDWKPYERITVEPGEYVHHGFPDAFSAHWVRLRTKRGGVVTAQFVYH